MLTSVILIILMLLWSAFFSGMEIAFTSKNRLKLEIDRKQSRMFDHIAEIFSRHPGQYITTILVGNNIALVIYSLYMSLLQLLMDFGLDVICIKSTQNRYFVGSRLLELPELKLLVDAVESSHLITEKKSTALIEKLGHLTSRHNAALLNRPVYMDGTAKPDNEAVYYAIDAIQTAIHKQRAISFQYFEYTPKKEKVLKHKGYRYGFSPYVLIWSRDFYYAVGWSEKHGKLAQFRVDRMTAIQDSDAPYIADPSFDPASYIREIFGMYHDMPQRVTLLCENRTMRNIIDHFGEDVDTEVVDANHFRATVDVAPTPPFFSWVFTFGGAIRIEGPGEALAKMRDMASWLHT